MTGVQTCALPIWGDRQASTAIERLSGRLEAAAEVSFQKGLKYYRQKKIRSARKAFLLALAYKPDHRQALDYLKNKLEIQEGIKYTLKKEDTLAGIAIKVYGDAELGDFVGVIIHDDTGSGIKPGAAVILPDIAKIPIAPDLKDDIRLAEAREFFRKGRYQEAMVAAKTILEYEPTYMEARNIFDSSAYQIGLGLFRGKKYAQALQILRDLDPDFRNVSHMISFIERYFNSMAEAHYRAGAQYYSNEQIEDAVKEWEKTLSFNPDHLKAKDGMKKVGEHFGTQRKDL